MESSPSSRTRGSAFTRDQVVAGFWYVLGVAHRLTPVGEGDAGHLRDAVAPVLAQYALEEDAVSQVVGVIVAARTRAHARARGEGSDAAISVATYEKVRQEVVSGWGGSSVKGVALWPPTGRTVATRLGAGRWNGALEELGVATSSRGRERGRGRFTREDHLAALTRFLRESAAAGGSSSFGDFTDWARGQRAAGRAVPAPATVRQHFGSWSAGLDAARLETSVSDSTPGVVRHIP